MPRNKKRKKAGFRGTTTVSESQFYLNKRGSYVASNSICQSCGSSLEYDVPDGLRHLCIKGSKNWKNEPHQPTSQNFVQPILNSHGTSFENSQITNFVANDQNFNQDKYIVHPDTWERRIYFSDREKPSNNFSSFKNSHDLKHQSESERSIKRPLIITPPPLPPFDNDTDYRLLSNSYLNDPSGNQNANYYTPPLNTPSSISSYQSSSNYKLPNNSYNLPDQVGSQRANNNRPVINTPPSVPLYQNYSASELLNKSHNLSDLSESQRATNNRPLLNTPPPHFYHRAPANDMLLNTYPLNPPPKCKEDYKRKRVLQYVPIKRIKSTPYEAELECSQYDQLSQNIMSYFRENIQTEEVFSRKMTLRSRLQQIIQKKFSGCRVFVFGSSMTGFATKDSDADMSLIFYHQKIVKNRVIKLLWELRTLLSMHRTFKKLKVINAKVSILKFQDNLSGFEVDLNINNPTGIRNSQLLRSYARLDERVQPLVLAVKYWARQHDINDAKNGTLSSYCLGLMLINYLQCGCHPPVLPSLQLLQPDKYLPDSDILSLEVDEVLPDFVSKNIESVGQLFVGFLHYYSKQFNYETKRISVRMGCVLPRVDKMLTKEKTFRHWIDIEEPFEQTNTARAVSNNNKAVYIKSVFDNSYISAIRKISEGLV